MAAVDETRPAYQAPNPIAAAVWDACIAEIEAPKPGNVSFASPGHGMTADDFVASARCTAEVLGTPGLSLGERVLGSIEATRAAVGCNTNLGIVMLCAPLAQAALDESPDRPLRAALAQVLAAASIEDTEQVFAAIRLAEPAGLGASARHDVRAPAAASLLAVMRAAEDRDRIARQYARCYGDVFELGIPTLDRSRRLWSSEAAPPETPKAGAWSPGRHEGVRCDGAALPGCAGSLPVWTNASLRPVADGTPAPPGAGGTAVHPGAGGTPADPGGRSSPGVPSRQMAVVALYLEFLARFKDSHIQRKLGGRAAEAIRLEARTLAGRLDPSRSPVENFEDLAEFDRRLKCRRINPGTSADLTVATLLAGNLLHARGNRAAARGAERGRG